MGGIIGSDVGSIKWGCEQKGLGSMNANEYQLKEASGKAWGKRLGILFLKGADPARFGKLLGELANYFMKVMTTTRTRSWQRTTILSTFWIHQHRKEVGALKPNR